MPAAGGQALVEFALILPVFLMILMGMLEFGSAYDHRTAMAYAVREGARVGATLGNGGSYPDTVDPTILAAVQRGLTDPILVENITSIEIFKAGLGRASRSAARSTRTTGSATSSAPPAGRRRAACRRA